MQLEGTLLLQDPTAQKAYTFHGRNYPGTLSGFSCLQSTMDGDVREIREIKLYEVSVVTFPMNENATISSVKCDDEVQHHLQALRGHQKGKRHHIKALLGDDLDDGTPADDPAFLEGNDSEAAPPRTR